MLGENFETLLIMQSARKAPSATAAKVSKFKMESCPSCSRKSVTACRVCMEAYYDHMHDENGERLQMKGSIIMYNYMKRKEPDVEESTIQYNEEICGSISTRKEFSMDKVTREIVVKVVPDRCSFDGSGRCNLTAKGRTLHCQRGKK